MIVDQDSLTHTQIDARMIDLPRLVLIADPAVSRTAPWHPKRRRCEGSSQLMHLLHAIRTLACLTLVTHTSTPH